MILFFSLRKRHFVLSVIQLSTRQVDKNSKDAGLLQEVTEKMVKGFIRLARFRLRLKILHKTNLTFWLIIQYWLINPCYNNWSFCDNNSHTRARWGIANPDEFWTAEEVSVYQHIPQSTFYKIAQAKVLPGFKVGIHWRFRRDTIIN